MPGPLLVRDRESRVYTIGFVDPSTLVDQAREICNGHDQMMEIEMELHIIHPS